MAQSNIVAQGWLYDFAKTNRPVENTWYNLKVDANGQHEQGVLQQPARRDVLGDELPVGQDRGRQPRAQLGNWEPQKGYYFVDDDEWSFWAPEGQAQTRGKPMNLDWGYLNAFFNTMILPERVRDERHRGVEPHAVGHERDEQHDRVRRRRSR